MSLLQGALELLFPAKCPFCAQPHRGGGLCPRCQESLPWRQGAQGEGWAEFLDGYAYALQYQGAVRGCIHRYKFSRKLNYAPTLGTLAAQCAQDHYPQPFDLISWPPLSPKGLRRRGFDQAQLLAQAVAAQRGGEATPLFRKKDGRRKQSSLRDPAARRANVLGAYTLLEPSLAAGRRVLLVDDVVTTGATLSECARLLRMAGAAEVWGVALAHGDGRSRPHA